MTDRELLELAAKAAGLKPFDATYPPCPECGEREPHWVGMPLNLEEIMAGIPQEGFWTCAKFYGPDGRRLV